MMTTFITSLITDFINYFRSDSWNPSRFDEADTWDSSYRVEAAPAPSLPKMSSRDRSLPLGLRLACLPRELKDFDRALPDLTNVDYSGADKPFDRNYSY
jgi:hypothetical protein